METKSSIQGLSLLFYLGLSLFLTGILFFVDEQAYSFEFLKFGRETFNWILFALVSWGIAVGVSYLVRKLKVPYLVSVILTIVVGFLPLYLIIIWVVM